MDDASTDADYDFAASSTDNDSDDSDSDIMEISNCVPLRNLSQFDIAGKRRPQSLNLKDTLNFLLKISTLVIQSSSG